VGRSPAVTPGHRGRAAHVVLKQITYETAKDVCRFPAATNDDRGGGHPSRKPLRLLTHLVGLFSSKGDKIAEPFLGSGTTLIAADRVGRTCVGAEIDPLYCAQIIAGFDKFAKEER
jgi:DNA modification methylase